MDNSTPIYSNNFDWILYLKSLDNRAPILQKTLQTKQKQAMNNNSYIYVNII